MDNLPAYYINREARPERRAFMEGQFATLGLAVTRMPAIEADAIDQAARERYCDPRAVSFLREAQLACAMSHAACWRQIDESGAPWGLVLEDDAILSARLPAFLEAFDGAGRDLVSLETTRRRARVLPAVATVGPGIALRPFRSAQWGAAGYLISRRAAQVLLSRPDLFDQNVDLSLFTPYWGPSRGLRHVVTDPALCMQLDRIADNPMAKSDIRPPALPPLAVDASVRTWRRLRAIGYAVTNAIDHMVHLPLGLTSQKIEFDPQHVLPAG